MATPSWANPKNYPEAPGAPRITIEQWRWESLRRTPEYRRDWANLTSGDKEDKLRESGEMYERYRIYPAQDPAVSPLHDDVLLMPGYPRRYGGPRSERRQSFLLSKREVALVFDFTAPHADQLERAKALLHTLQDKAVQVGSNPHGVTRTEKRHLLQRHRWPQLLQVVDAVHECGNQPAARSRIAKILKLAHDHSQTSYVDNYYRWGLTMWEWLCYPKEADKT
jgi:hypothetical protein